MAEGGFYEQKRLSPTGLTLVVALHAAGIAALILAKGPSFILPERSDPEVVFIPAPTDPPPVPPRPQPERDPQQQRTQLDTPPVRVPTPPRGPTVDPQPMPPQPWTNTAPGEDIVTEPQPQPLPPPPPPPQPAPPRVVEAARARGSLQGLFRPDDYPRSAVESEAEGSTGVRLTINGDGRVTSCSVTRSSGSRALDGATCNVLRSRARYTPARDQNNQPTTDSQNATITWRLSE
jgi:protein TonB